MSSPSMLRGAWLGLAAIALHLLAPFASLALYGAMARAADPARDHAQHAHHDPSTAHAHHGHAANAAAEHAPLNPDLMCIGDCPWCSLSDRPVLLMARSVLLLLPPLNIIGAVIASAPAPHVFAAGTHRLSRGPPLLA